MSSSVHDYASPSPPSGNGAVCDMTEVLVARLHEAIEIKSHHHRSSVKLSRAINAAIARITQYRDSFTEDETEEREAANAALKILREEAMRAND